MLITTASSIPGKKIVKDFGLVKGNTVRSKWFGKDIMAGLKTIIGGEIKGYTEMMTEAREEALKRMKEDAKKHDADAIVNVRFMTSMIMTSASEIMAYGNAVKLE